MKLAALLLSLLVMGCAIGPPSSGDVSRVRMRAADEAISSGNYEAAYNFLDDVISVGDPNYAGEAVAKIKGNPRLIAAAPAVIQRAMVSDAEDLMAADSFTAQATSSPARFLEALSTGHAASVGMIGRFKQLDPKFDSGPITEAALREAVVAFDKRRDAERDKAAREKAEADAKAALFRTLAAAERDASIECASQRQCDRAFALTQIYVSEKADMKIQVATEVIIETYNPNEAGKVGMKAIRMPGKNDSSDIRLTISCKAETPAELDRCIHRKIDLYDGFATFMRNSM